MAINKWDIPGVLTWCKPCLLRGGDKIHVDVDVLSVVHSTAKGRAGTEEITLEDGRMIVVCGATDVAVFR